MNNKDKKKLKLSKVDIIFAIIQMIIGLLAIHFLSINGFIKLIFGYFIFIICYIVIIMRHYIWQKLKRYILFIVIVLSTLMIAFIIHQLYNNGLKLKESDILSFYGSYLTFVGTFGLGYFVYKKDEEHRFDEKINKCKLLCSCLNSTNLQMMRVGRYNYN